MIREGLRPFNLMSEGFLILLGAGTDDPDEPDDIKVFTCCGQKKFLIVLDEGDKTARYISNYRERESLT